MKLQDTIKEAQLGFFKDEVTVVAVKGECKASDLNPEKIVKTWKQYCRDEGINIDYIDDCVPVRRKIFYDAEE